MNAEYFRVIFINDEINSFPEKFGIITACNPKDQILSASENRARNLQLKKQIIQKMDLCGEIVGSSPDKAHQELSFVVKGSVKHLLQLGKDFEQNAIFWIEKDSLHLMDCLNKKAFKVGSFRERIVGSN